MNYVLGSQEDFGGDKSLFFNTFYLWTTAYIFPTIIFITLILLYIYIRKSYHGFSVTILRERIF
jgi:hypothetical protein